jgi:hypothetical protein
MKTSYFLLVAVIIAVIAIVLTPIIRTKNKAASNGQETIQSLSTEAARLKDARKSLSFLNTLFLIGVALFSAGLVVTARLSDESADELSEVQTRLDKIKDEAFRSQLGALETTAAEANKKAGELNKSAEELKHRNLILEKALAPRIIEIKGSPDEVLKGLKKFSGTEVIITSITDAEARRAAGAIAWALSWAGWKVIHWPPSDSFLSQDGVRVELPPMPVINQEEINKRSKQAEARQAIVAFLKEKGWQEVDWGTSSDKDPSPSIRIRVGFKPQPLELLK